MIERAIENWLTKTNERNFHIPFCQVLLNSGHKIIYISPHRQMEQGKDIFTIAPDGEYCAYQLKTGNIDTTVWRDIKGEIDELIQLPFQHPEVDRQKQHKSFLVTNGVIKDEVRLQIRDINEDNRTKNRNYSYLSFKDRDELLGDFIDAQKKFLPAEISDVKLYLELFLSNGRDLFPREKYFYFLTNTLFTAENAKQKANLKNAIGSSVIVTAYLLNNFQTAQNYTAIIEAWILLYASLIQYAKKNNADKVAWADSARLIIAEIAFNFEQLTKELDERKNLLEGVIAGDGGIVYNARATILLGNLAAFENYKLTADTAYKPSTKLINLIAKYKSNLWFWGESAFPFFFNLIKFLEAAGDRTEAQTLLEEMFLDILIGNDRKNEEGAYAGVYNTPEELLGRYLLGKKDLDYRQFAGSSHILYILVLMLAKRNKRDFIAKYWKDISWFNLLEFVPADATDFFAYHTGKGSNNSSFPNQTQSWAALLAEANDASDISPLYAEFRAFIYLYINVCPQRVGKSLIKCLDY